VHRIGRTGRAGRSGRAILLVDPRDRRALRGIEQATRQPLKILELAGDDELKQLRRDRFRQQLAERLAGAATADWQALAAEMAAQLQQSPEQLAAGLLALLADQHGLNAALPPAPKAVPTEVVRDKRPRREFEERGESRGKRAPTSDEPSERYRLAVGRSHQIKVGDIVGAIANEAGIDSNHIGRIQLFDDYSTVDLPAGMPREMLAHLKTVRVRSHPLNICRFAEGGGGDSPAAAPSPRPPRREERPTREPRGETPAAPRRKLALKH
jgi:ATP-dependent RNA helicase DeaD